MNDFFPGKAKTPSRARVAKKGAKSPSSASKAAKKPAPGLVIFKVALYGNLRTWRKIAVRQDQTLDDLHEAIFTAFDRDEEHLYSFYLLPPGAPKSQRPRRPKNAIEFMNPLSWEGDPESFDASESLIADLKPYPRQRLMYLFDFGDSWWHDITVESVGVAVQAGVRYPCVLEKHGDSPPQYVFDDEEEM